MPLGLRWLTILSGGACFIWLGFEDTTMLPVVVLGALLAICVVGGVLTTQEAFQASGQAHHAALFILIGALIGALAAIMTTLLMFLKTAWHSHIAPDYPTLMMLAMLERAPVWATAGSLTGAALVLIEPLFHAWWPHKAIRILPQRPDTGDSVEV